MTRTEALERIAAAAQMVRDLEKSLTTATDTRMTMSRLLEARQQLDEALADLAQVGREE